MTRSVGLAVVLAAFSPLPLLAQGAQGDREGRLDAVLPGPHASAIKARAAEARALGLPGDAIVLRALELAAKGARPDEVTRRVALLADRLVLADLALRLGGGGAPGPDAVVAGADALASGLATAQLRSLAQSGTPTEALAGRIIAVMALLDRGLAPDAAITAVAIRPGAAPRPVPASASVGGTEVTPPLVPTATGRDRPSEHRPRPPQIPPPGRPPTVS